MLEVVKKRLKSDTESDLLQLACLMHKWAKLSKTTENKAGRDFGRSSGVCLPQERGGKGTCPDRRALHRTTEPLKISLSVMTINSDI